VPNGQGVFILYGSNNLFFENVISGNSGNGINIAGSGATHNIIVGNDIGVGADGSSALGNGGAGILINGSAYNIIGELGAEEGNVIANNAAQGVDVLDQASIGNEIRGNSIYANGALGIDLGGDGVTPNHTGQEAGPNNFQNYPVLDAARHGSITRVVGHFNSLPNTTYTLDFYASTSADPSGFGQGLRYLGTGQVTTDGSGNATFDSNSFTGPLGASLSSEFITATATDPAGNTSEFSAVKLANSGPVAVNDAYLVQENSPTSSLAVLTNDYDPAGDSFTITQATTPAHGSAAISGNTILYTPASGYYGADSFTYTISDAYGDTSTATVTITVNAPPQAFNDAYTVQENHANNVLNVLANDFDPDGDPLTITGTSAAANGTATISGSNILYTPATGYYGADSFTYTISDGQGGTSSATVSLFVNAPPQAANDAYTVQQNSSNNVLNVLANDSDPDGDPLTITGTSAAAHGTTTINGSNILYTPAAGYYGADSFTYSISDGQGGTSTATVSITVSFNLVTITGTVFQDQNDNHVQDPGEPGLSGWTVQLDSGAMTATTNASGAYTFTGVGPGSHTVSEVVQSAYIETSPRGDVYTFDTSNGLNVSGKNFANEILTNARDDSLPGYSENGGGWTTLNAGWLGTSRLHQIDTTGKSSATWSLNVGAPGGVPAGKYEVFVTYVPAAGRATLAPYTLLDNKTLLTTVYVNQTLTPSDGLYQGVRWLSLGVFTFNSGKPVVSLSANSTGIIDADGVLLIPASAYAPPMNALYAPLASSTTRSALPPKALPDIGYDASHHNGDRIVLSGVWLGGHPSVPASAVLLDEVMAMAAHSSDGWGSRYLWSILSDDLAESWRDDG
jgi:hypothetical protein